MEQIGLEAILKDEQFKAAIKNYVKEVTAADKTTSKSSTNMSQSFSNAGKGLNDLVRQFTGMNLATLGFAGGVALIGKSVVKGLNDLVAYGGEVRNLKVQLGTTAEEASKILQVADDLEISTTTLTTAFKTMQKAGVAPSIAGLKDMIKQYQAIPNPTDRAAFALKNFGMKGGPEMQRLLEMTPEAIDAIAKSAENMGLVLDDLKLEKIEAYRLAVDDLGDSWKGLKMEALMPLLDPLTEFVENITAFVGETKKATEGASFWENALRSLPFVAQIIAIKEWTDGVRENNTEVPTATTNTNEYADAFEREAMHAANATTAVEENNEAVKLSPTYLDEGERALRANSLAKEAAITLAEEAAKAAREEEEAQLALNEALKESWLEAGLDGTLQTAWDEYQAALAEANGEEAEAYEQFKKTTAEIIYQKLAVGLDADAALELARSLGLVSEADYNLAKGLDELKEKSGTEDMGLLAEAAQILAKALLDGDTYADALAKALDYLNGKTFQTTFIINWVGEQPPFGTPNPGDDPDPVIGSSLGALYDAIAGMDAEGVFNVGAGVSNFASAIGGRYRAKVLDPMAEGISEIEDQIDALNDSYDDRLKIIEDIDEKLARGGLTWQQGQDLISYRKKVEEALLYYDQERVKLNDKLAAAGQEYADAQERALKLEQAQADLDFLKQQMDFLKFMEENELDPSTVLGDLQLGLNADLPALMDAMTRAMEQVIMAGNEKIGEAWPVTGTGGAPVPPPSGGAGVQITFNGGVTLSNGIELADFQAAVEAAVVKALGG